MNNTTNNILRFRFLRRPLKLVALLAVMMMVMPMAGWGATVTYHIINLGRLNDSGQLTTSTRTEALRFTSSSLTVGLPDKYKSPLAKNWKYYTSDEITYNEVTKAYTFAESTTLVEGASVLSDGDHVYVTYELDEDKISDVGLYDGGVCRIKFPDGYYLKQTIWQSEVNTGSDNTNSTASVYLWKFNIIDPYQITVQSQSQSSDNCFDYYLCSKGGNFGDIRLKATLSEARDTKVWVFGLLNGGTDGTYRLVVTDGYSVLNGYIANSPSGYDSFGHGYLNNNDNHKTRYMKYYSSNTYKGCDLAFVPLTKTYNIVNNSGETLVQATTTDYPLEVPDVIKSPFASYTYYSTQADAIAGTNPINSVTSTTIYVRYTTQSGDLNLNGGTNYIIRTNDNYLYAASSTTLGIESSLSDPPANTRKWKITGNDAYQLTIQNVDNSQYVTYDVSSGEAVPTLSGTGSKFFLHQSTTGQYEVVAITSGYYSTNYYTMGVANSTLKLYSSSNYPMGQDEVQSVIYSQPTCATPVISFDNTTSQVTITCATEGATIHYTTNGDEPTESSPSTPNPFPIDAPTTVKAIATLAGYLDSEREEKTIEQVAQPTIQNNGSNAISITCATEGATIYYEINGTPVVGSSQTYSDSEPLRDGVSGQTINAIAVKGDMINSEVGTGSVTLMCDGIVIQRDGEGFKITCTFPSTGATIYYETAPNDGTPATPNTSTSQSTSSGAHIDWSDFPITVTAIATAPNYNNSFPPETTYLPSEIHGSGTSEDPYLITSQPDVALFIDKANEEPGAYFIVTSTEPLDFSLVDPITASFTGTFDGGGQTLTGLTHAIFNTVNGGVVKNVMLKDVTISSSADTVGAITNIAKGYSRIYNCGILPTTANFPDGTHSSVSTSGACAGGLVGRLQNDSRVVNCFSYADVRATDLAAGLVGDNRFGSTAAVSNGKYTNLRTMVVNCMFYGDILGGTNQYPVYGGSKITNSGENGINSYCWYRYGCTFTAANGHPFKSGGAYQQGEPTDYFCCFPADVRYLTQVEFHRSVLNSNRELCGWWVGSDVAPNTLTTAQVQAIPKDASLMYKWVLDPNIAPYPILKPFGKYPSIVNGNTGTPWFDRTTANPYEGKQLGTLKVNVKSGSHSSAADKTVYIPITDMDTLHYDYGYRKVQLPYFNTVFGNPEGTDWAAKYAGNYTDWVVTGWKVTDVNHTGANSFSPHWETGYNFADRDCTDKDLFTTSNRVFAQGGNYYVPNGVTEITIEAYWGKAIYIRSTDGSYDRVNITKGNNGALFGPVGTRQNNVNNQTIISTTIRSALTTTNIPTKATVYDYAFVLVGNMQESVGGNNVTVTDATTRGFTIMSVDLDFDEEPDYCLEWQLGSSTDRQDISPVRFDFLPVVELGAAMKLDGSTYFLSLGCFRPLGHFEVTETSFIRFGQFEYELGTRDDGPIILNGGIFDQYTRGKNDGSGQHITYTILGGHLVMPSFTPGAHVNSGSNHSTRHCAVNALGGDFSSFYLTGGFNENVSPYDDNPHCYIDGGRFGTVASAYKEGIKGDVFWRINHALIGEFYGGGMMSQSTGNNYKIVKGNIDVVIDSSIVRKYCGGPKFGDMVAGKTVTTHATGTTFTDYYGAGNGGTNYVQYANRDRGDIADTDGFWMPNNQPNSTNLYGNLVSYTPELYQYTFNNNTYDHYQANYEMELINVSSGTDAGKAVCRTYFFGAQFATTNTGTVTNTLTGCTVLRNYYGAGFLGGVNGNVISTLTDTRVQGSVFGAGYSATVPSVTFYNKFRPGATGETVYDLDKSIPKINFYTGMVIPPGEGTGKTYTWSNNGSTSEPVTNTTNFYTSVPLDNLGAVSGTVTLTLTGNSVIGTEGDNTTGNVYGGGDASAVNGNTTVTLQGNAHVLGNVYGGGNNGAVGGSSKVEIQDPQP